METDLRKMKKVTIDVEGMSITAQGGCQAIELEPPLQELGYSVVMSAANNTGSYPLFLFLFCNLLLSFQIKNK
jgi:hypothetical protein